MSDWKGSDWRDWSLLGESVERASVESMYRASPEPVRERLGLELREIGGALVSTSTVDPSPLLNRTLSLGVEEPASREAVGSIVARYRERGIDRYYVHVSQEAEPAELRDWLRAVGLGPGRGWMKFYRDLDDPPQTRSGLEVDRIGKRHAAAFGRIVARGFGMAAESAELLEALVGQPGWFVYLARERGEPAAGAAMFVHDDVAYLGWAATLEEYRGRGAQSALLRQRIVDALELECQVMLTETGEAIAGQPQHSYDNIIRAGFEPAYLRENFVPMGGP